MPNECGTSRRMKASRRIFSGEINRFIRKHRNLTYRRTMPCRHFVSGFSHMKTSAKIQYNRMKGCVLMRLFLKVTDPAFLFILILVAILVSLT
ncbi:hypothetical protein, partial [Pediococcus acidilactici]|uniref:hypothetical protein n=1 Tax=Pediococcus acidilactici TaxID=1254 RepID=UPI003A8D1A9E